MRPREPPRLLFPAREDAQPALGRLHAGLAAHPAFRRLHAGLHFGSTAPRFGWLAMTFDKVGP